MTSQTATVKITKSAYWQEKIEAWNVSGLTQHEFCLQNTLRFATFTYWRSRLSLRRKAAKKKVLLPIDIQIPKAPLTAHCLRIKCPNGLLIEYPSTLSQSDTKKLFLALGINA